MSGHGPPFSLGTGYFHVSSPFSEPTDQLPLFTCTLSKLQLGLAHAFTVVLGFLHCMQLKRELYKENNCFAVKISLKCRNERLVFRFIYLLLV